MFFIKMMPIFILLAVTVPSFASPLTREAIKADWARQEAVRFLPQEATPENDAAGGCDGVISGTWGFHTAREPNPWWQVDLGSVTPVERIRIHNRCDGGYEARAARLLILLSENGSAFRQVYQHTGVPFLGQTDNRPLEVSLSGEAARFVRIQLPGTDYLHLDEIEVYASGSDDNSARDKPATQSSTSPWSVAHGKSNTEFMGIDSLVKRGRALLADLRELEAPIAEEAAQFENAATHAAALPLDASAREREAIHMELLWAIRGLALRNPLLNFDKILFVKRAPTMFPHVSDQYYGWFSRGGGGLYILSGFKADAPQVRCITPDWPEGNFLRPDISYDGSKVVFSWCRYYPHVAEIKDKTVKTNLPEDAFYHIFEMNLDGTGIRQLTRGYYDDMDARYLPGGDIVFLSTRKGTALQAGHDSAQATCTAIQPDSYVRCGGDAHRPVPVFTLHRINADGGDLRAISAFENFEWTPAVNHDGQVLYVRWDYIDRFNGDFMSLWSTHPDGTQAQLVFGNFTHRPQCIFEARPIPGSRKLVFTATAHHSITGGSLVLLDRTRGTEYEAPLERITPEICFPETEGSPPCYYAGPWPLSERHFLVSWSDTPLPIHAYMKGDDKRNPSNASAIYLYDAFGNLNLLHRDPTISSETPIPIQPRPKPFQLPESVNREASAQGVFLLQDLYQGMNDVARGTITRLRVVGVIPKVQPFMNQPSLGVSAEDPGKVVLGTVPVEPDGSAHFAVPSGVPVFFQALDKDNMAVRTMRTLTYVQPGHTLSCVGCHESRESTPVVHRSPAAARRAPSLLTPEAEGTWPLRYDTLVQPVLDASCVRCHQPGYDDARAAAFDLTPGKSYDTLIGYADNDLRTLAFEKDRSEVGDCVARQSKLLAFLTAEGSHEGITLDRDSLDRLKVWMDTYAHRQGAFSVEQETQLAALREQATWISKD